MNDKKEKVIKHICMPLKSWFTGSKMDAGTYEIYTMVLGEYSEECLQAGMQDVIQTWQKSYRPQPADIKAACDKHARYAPQGYEEKRDFVFAKLEENIFRTPAGKRALREGVAASFLNNCANGKKCSEFTDEDFNDLQRAKKEARPAYESLTDDKDNLQKMLRKLYHSMMDKEQRLQQKYRNFA